MNNVDDLLKGIQSAISQAVADKMFELPDNFEQIMEDEVCKELKERPELMELTGSAEYIKQNTVKQRRKKLDRVLHPCMKKTRKDFKCADCKNKCEKKRKKK